MKKLNALMTNILIISFLFVANYLFAQTAWQWKNPLPQGNDLRCVKFANEDVGYAVGNVGTIIKTTDGGENWTVQYSGTTIDLLSVCAVDENIAYATGMEDPGWGTLLKTANGGEDWIELNEPYRPRSIFFTNPETGYICGEFGRIYKTIDSGESWTEVNYDPSTRLQCIYFVNENVGFAVGYMQIGKIYKTTDAGETWLDIYNQNNYWYRSVYFTSVDTGYVVGHGVYESIILSTYNGGDDWNVQNPEELNLNSIDFINQNTGFIVGLNDLLKTTDAGVTWTNVGSYGGNYICFQNQNLGYIVREYGKIMITTDGGVSWNDQHQTVTNNKLTSVYFPNASTGYAVGENGTILKTTDGGNNWSGQNSGSTNFLASVCFTNLINGIAVGSYGTILKTTNGGANWTNQFSGISDYLASVFFVNPDIGYTAGGNKILKTSDGGANWINLGFGYNCTLSSIFFFNSEIGIAVGGYRIINDEYNGLIFKTYDGGNNWIVIDTIPDKRPKTVIFPNDATGFIGGEDGLILKSTDQGEHWDEIMWPLTTEDDIEAFSFIDENQGYAVMNNDASYGHLNITKLLTTTDGFEWEIYENYIFSQNEIYSIFFTNIDTAIIVGNNGTILKTNTAGIPVQIKQIESPINNFKIYPNPAFYSLTIEASDQYKKGVVLRIYNLTGQQILNKQIEKLNTEIDISKLSPGLYLINIQTDETNETKKFIKK